MFPERNMLHDKLNAFNRIVPTESSVIIVEKVVWSRQTIVAHFAGFPRVDGNRVGHFV